MRTMFEVSKDIFDALYVESPLLKTELARESKLNTDSLDQWIDMIDFIQRQPKLFRKKIGKRIEVIDLEKEVVSETITPEIVKAMVEFEKRLEDVEKVKPTREAETAKV
ncbi:MAG: hypothetical protein V3R82_04370 [Candidatus Hydrothermarchaeales archaeon]